MGLTWPRCSLSPSDASSASRCQHGPCRDPGTGRAGVLLVLGAGGLCHKPAPHSGAEIPRQPGILPLCPPWGWLCRGVRALLLLGSPLSQPGVGRLGTWARAQPPALPASLWPRSSAADMLARVSQCAWEGAGGQVPARGCVGTLACSGVPQPSRPGQAPRAQLGASSGDSAGASSPAAARRDSGRRNLLS